MQNLHDLLIERMVIHDNPGEHGIYLGCREDVNSNITVRGCRIYRNAQQGFQHNGRVKNLLLEDNLIHTNGQAGVQLMMGVCDSTIRHNLIFNNAKQGVSFFNYVSSESDILPYDMHNNVVEDNVIWVGRKDWHDQYNTSEFAAVQFNDSTGAKAPTLSGNIVRRNILVTSDGPVIEFRQERFGPMTTIQNNIIYRAGGRSKVIRLGDRELDLDTFNGFCPLWKNNLFGPPAFRRANDNLYLKPELFDFTRP